MPVQAPSALSALQHFGNLLGGHWLGQVRVESRLRGSVSILRLPVPRHGDQPHVRAKNCSNLCRDLVAIESGKAAVRGSMARKSSLAWSAAASRVATRSCCLARKFSPRRALPSTWSSSPYTFNRVRVSGNSSRIRCHSVGKGTLHSLASRHTACSSGKAVKTYAATAAPTTSPLSVSELPMTAKLCRCSTTIVDAPAV